MPFKGIIRIASDVSITLSASNGNLHSAALLAGLTVDPSGSKHAVVAPGGSETIGIKADKDSILEIQFHFESPAETGNLEVKVNGAQRNSDPVNGHETWMYSCEP
jgi:hypothetical protein